MTDTNAGRTRKPSAVRAESQRYRSLTGHNYRSAATGKRVRVEAGEECIDLPGYAVETELRAGKIEVIGGENG